ncbi:MAG: FG-GAP-like repeat-containing protein, partial [Bryobacteraceae bacterium]
FEKYILPGQDEFTGEKEAFVIRKALERAFQSKRLPLAPGARIASPLAKSYRAIAPDLHEAVYDPSGTGGWDRWIESLGSVRRAEFFVLPGNTIRYEIASAHEYRVGHWKQIWKDGLLTELSPIEEHVARAEEPWMRDVTAAAIGGLPAFQEQFSRGVPYWRARLDPATGIDIYGSNGIAAGDIDGDGRDEIYICQPGGLPNRLLKFQEDGTAADITHAWGLDLLDDTSCALFLDLRNSGRQDLVVLLAAGPVLFLNEGKRYRRQPDAFHFATKPKGGFTGMAAADFDRDGKLDLYLCCYVYFLNEAQFTYASPYDDAQNGPPNFLFRNKLSLDGSGFFEDCTEETGMNQNNNRFSFAPAWCDYNGDGWPDLSIANDFGRNNLYRNTGGHFRDVAKAAGVLDIAPGMSASWFDYNGDGQPDIYIANMWTAAGQRIIHDPHFLPAQKAPEAYRAHTMGNSLFQNRGDGAFSNTTDAQHVAFGRWAWGSGAFDLNNDGIAEILGTCGMLTNTSAVDLSSFFWRQVVAKSPTVAAPSLTYEHGWNALNQFIREEYSWNGREPNVFHARRGGRYFDFSGVSGFDFADDSRAFAVIDFDGDGRPDIILKSRLGPQVRVLQNNCAGENRSIGFRLRGTKSNRDAIGARVEVDGQAKWLEAGSGFLSQHSKTMLFGLGTETVARNIKIVWPSGAVQQFENLATGSVYSIVEGSQDIRHEPFRAPRRLPDGPVASDNAMRLEDTWFVEPIPLPEKQRGPGLFVVKEQTVEYETFRRYLFDWRTKLVPPLPMLLNSAGDLVKVYGKVPSQRQVDRDLALLKKFTPKLALPFDGVYIAPPKRNYFKFGAAFLWAGLPQQALPYLQRVLRQTPDNPRVLVLAGEIEFDAGHADQAGTYFQRALGFDPKSVQALIGLGDVAAKKEQSPKAAGFYGKALQLDPKSAAAANGLGLALAKQGQLDPARKYFEQAIAAQRDFAEAINNLGVLYIRQGKINDAIAAFQYGIRVAPDKDILYLNLGRTYVQMGQVARARQVMRQLLNRKPDSQTARRALQELSGR